MAVRLEMPFVFDRFCLAPGVAARLIVNIEMHLSKLVAGVVPGWALLSLPLS
jgi:hypothetical protein